MIRRFHDFLNLVFGGFLQYDPTVQRGARQQKRRTLCARWSSKARNAAIAMSDETAARVMS